jgi:tetratricopeptide (TPR) repeat protein
MRKIDDLIKEVYSNIESGNIENAIQIFFDNRFRKFYYTSKRIEKSKMLEKFCEVLLSDYVINPSNKKKFAISLIEMDLYKYNDAIVHLCDLVKVDPENPEYFYNLAESYSYIGNNKKAAENYEKSISKNIQNIWAYLGAAKARDQLRQFEKAKVHYENAIIQKANYSWTYYLYAEFLYSYEKYKEAIINYEKAIEYDNSDDNYILNRCKDKIELIKSSEDLREKSQFMKMIDEMLVLLRFEKNEVAHYTSISALKKLVFESSSFRLSEASFLNDPSEGIAIFDVMKTLNSKNEFLSEAMKSNSQKLFGFVRKPFVGSFVDGALSNNLTLWRMYGRENEKEATGCCLVFDTSKITDLVRESISKIINNDNEQTNQMISNLEYECVLYQVIYISSSGKIYINGNIELESKIIEILQKMADIVATQKFPNDFVFKQINRIACLFKVDEFEEESEVRIILSSTGLKPIIDTSMFPPKVFFQIGPINSIIKKIIIGPKTEYRDQLAAGLYYKMLDIGNQSEVLMSKLLYR